MENSSIFELKWLNFFLSTAGDLKLNVETLGHKTHTNDIRLMTENSRSCFSIETPIQLFR